VFLPGKKEVKVTREKTSLQYKTVNKRKGEATNSLEERKYSRKQNQLRWQQTGGGEGVVARFTNHQQKKTKPTKKNRKLIGKGVPGKREIPMWKKKKRGGIIHLKS